MKGFYQSNTEIILCEQNYDSRANLNRFQMDLISIMNAIDRAIGSKLNKRVTVPSSHIIFVTYIVVAVWRDVSPFRLVIIPEY